SPTECAGGPDGERPEGSGVGERPGAGRESGVGVVGAYLDRDLAADAVCTADPADDESHGQCSFRDPDSGGCGDDKTRGSPSEVPRAQPWDVGRVADQRPQEAVQRTSCRSSRSTRT